MTDCGKPAPKVIQMGTPGIKDAEILARVGRDAGARHILATSKPSDIFMVPSNGLQSLPLLPAVLNQPLDWPKGIDASMLDERFVDFDMLSQSLKMLDDGVMAEDEAMAFGFDETTAAVEPAQPANSEQKPKGVHPEAGDAGESSMDAGESSMGVGETSMGVTLSDAIFFKSLVSIQRNLYQIRLRRHSRQAISSSAR